MVVSAAIDKRRVAERRWGTHGMLGVAHDVDAVVTVEHEDVGDDRRRHQDDMRVPCGGRHLGHGRW